MTRIRKIFKRIVIAGLLVGSVLFAAFLWFHRLASLQVQAKLAPLLEAGKPTSLADLQRPSVAEEDNAAKAVAGQAESLRIFDAYLAKAQSGIADESIDQQTQAAIQVARQVDQEFPSLNQALRDAAKLPSYQMDVDETSDPKLLMDQICDAEVPPRTVIRALYGHGLMSIADGKPSDAIQDAIAMLHWTRHIAEQPLMINYLIATACYQRKRHRPDNSLPNGRRHHGK